MYSLHIFFPKAKGPFLPLSVINLFDSSLNMHVFVVPVMQVHETGYAQQLLRPQCQDEGTTHDSTLHDLLRQAAPQALTSPNTGV